MDEDEDFDEEEEISPDQEEVIEEPQQEVVEETVEALNQTGGSHVSFVTNTESHSSKNTVIHVTKDQDQEQNEDSSWDSDVSLFQISHRMVCKFKIVFREKYAKFILTGLVGLRIFTGGIEKSL